MVDGRDEKQSSLFVTVLYFFPALCSQSFGGDTLIFVRHAWDGSTLGSYMTLNNAAQRNEAIFNS